MKKNLFHKYEYGAHFQYRDLYKELLNLITKFPLERIGLNGIFFQRNINEKPINLPKFKEIKNGSLPGFIPMMVFPEPTQRSVKASTG